MPNDNNFAAWLEAALAGRPNVYLVRNSGKKENGRPVIDDSRVSKWLKGEQRPTMELATLAARVLGASQAEALKAAGHTYGHSLMSIERMERDYPLPRDHARDDALERLRALHAEMGEVLRRLDGGDGDADTTGGSAPIGADKEELSDVDETLLAAAKEQGLQGSGEEDSI